MAWQLGRRLRVWNFCLMCGLLKTRGRRDSGIINPGTELAVRQSGSWEAGRQGDREAGRQGGGHKNSRRSARVALHILWPSVSLPFPLPIPLPFSTGRGMPWPSPRLANLAIVVAE